MILDEENFIEDNDDDACEYGWTLNLEDDEARDEVIQALKLKQFVEARIKIDEYTMDDYVKNATAKPLTKEDSDRYWNAVHSYRILTNILEESKE